MVKETKWSIVQAHTEISFNMSHLLTTHTKGNFKLFDANIYTKGKDFTTAEVNLYIDASSIYTGDEKRDEHLKSCDFLDVKNYKQIIFVSSTIGKYINGKYELWGELTMLGITKNVKLEVLFGGILTDFLGNEKVRFTVTGKINRNDWGLTWNTPVAVGVLMIGEEVAISCKIELINISEKKSIVKFKSKNNGEAIF